VLRKINVVNCVIVYTSFKYMTYFLYLILINMQNLCFWNTYYKHNFFLLLFIYLYKNCFFLFNSSRKKHEASTAGIFNPYFMHFYAQIYLIRCSRKFFETGVARATYFGLIS
jgi:hypothetical protein